MNESEVTIMATTIQILGQISDFGAASDNTYTSYSDVHKLVKTIITVADSSKIEVQAIYRMTAIAKSRGIIMNMSRNPSQLIRTIYSCFHLRHKLEINAMIAQQATRLSLACCIG
jgi:hypothetical protein